MFGSVSVDSATKDSVWADGEFTEAYRAMCAQCNAAPSQLFWLVLDSNIGADFALSLKATQHAQCNAQHAAYSMQRTTCSVQHAAYNMQRTTYNAHHATQNTQHRPRARSASHL